MMNSSVDDRPLGVQFMGDDPDIVERAVEMAAPRSFDIIDFNAACPVRKVVSKSRGAGLLKDPLKLQKILKTIVRCTNRPVTVKIRSGWDETSINARDVALMAEDAGVSALFIHGRTRSQGYSGHVDYNIIRQVKDALHIPVIANGDALSPVLIKKIFDETGCDGVGIARGGLGNPWIFRDTADYLISGKLPPRREISDTVQIMKDHLDLNISVYGERRGVIGFRKFFAWYVRGMPSKDLKRRVFSIDGKNEMERLIKEVSKEPANTNSM